MPRPAITWAACLGGLVALDVYCDRRKDESTHRLSGRARDNRLVHFAVGDDVPRPGDVVVAEVTYAAPHHLVADKVIEVRRTRSGDAWEARSVTPKGVGLGMPTVGVPAPLPASACR